MTVAEYWLAEFSDLIGIQIACLDCGTATIYPAARWSELPHTCPTCHGALVRPQTPEHEMLRGLAQAIRATQSVALTGVAVRLVLPRPKAD